MSEKDSKASVEESGSLGSLEAQSDIATTDTVRVETRLAKLLATLKGEPPEEGKILDAEKGTNRIENIEKKVQSIMQTSVRMHDLIKEIEKIIK